MTFVAHDGTAYRCYTTRTGIDRAYLGCSHETPRQAIAHTVPVYVPASRSGSDGPPVSRTAGQRQSLSGTSGHVVPAASSAAPPVASTPDATGGLQLWP